MCGFGLGYGYFGGWSPWLAVMMVARVLIFAGIIVLAVKLIRNHTQGSNNALKILNEKFANGEMTEEEYQKRKNFISK